jgi:SAM-dependent methyltransferase
MSSSPQPSLFRSIRDWWKQSAAHHGPGATLRMFFSEVFAFLRESTPEQRRRRYGDIEYDWDNRVDTTSATVGWRDRLLGVFHSPYQPSEPALFHEMLASLHVGFEDFTFIDLGSGKGRTLLMASEYPFRRIVGVELLPELHRIAQENLRKFKSEKQRCFHLETRCEDARCFIFPNEPTVLYLFNPLSPTDLRRALANLEDSTKLHPRKVCVLYHNPLHDRVITANGWLKRMRGTHQYAIYEPT